MNYLITAVDLIKQQSANNADTIVVFDCRCSLMDAEAGKKAYLEEHIPGAFYADLNTQLSSPHQPGLTGRHPLPDRADWINQVQQWGIRPEYKVVVYDDVGGVFASRLWWLLRWIGHDNTAVLNGGWQAWLEAGDESTEKVPEGLERSDFDYAALEPLTLTINVDDIDAGNQLLLDAREAKRFAGEVEPIDPIAGHIPGAICSPTSGNTNANGEFKSAEELREKFAPAFEAGQKELVCYCGSGVSAAHNVLAMRVAGLDEPRLYVGSWSEWITDPTRPIATNTDTE